MLPRVASMLKKDMKNIRSTTAHSDVAEAQKQILDTIVRLEDEGDIAIRYDWELYG